MMCAYANGIVIYIPRDLEVEICDGASSCPLSQRRCHYDRDTGRMECDDCPGEFAMWLMNTIRDEQTTVTGSSDHNNPHHDEPPTLSD